MDYNRKELVDWIRGIYQNLDDADKQDALRFFPELRESEDERIRKEIISIVKEYGRICEKEGDPCSTIGDCLAYLEKQEQKPNIELIQRSWYMEGYHDREFGKEPMWLITACDGGPRYEENPKYGQMLAEQKPAEWSEEDEKIMQTMIKEGDLKPSEIAWLKSLRPQPDKEIYQAARHDLAIKFMNYLDENRPEGKMCLSNGECEDINKAFKENDWAKIIRYVKKYSLSWKPSELEKGALRTAIFILTKERSFPKAAAQLQNILDAFEGKESRKDWKPSKEQMTILWDAISNLKHDGYKHTEELISFYEQLKKL